MKNHISLIALQTTLTLGAIGLIRQDGVAPQAGGASATGAYEYGGLAYVSGDLGQGPIEAASWQQSGKEGFIADDEYDALSRLGYKGNRDSVGFIAILDYMDSLGWEYVDTQFYPEDVVSIRRFVFRRAK